MGSLLRTGSGARVVIFPYADDGKLLPENRIAAGAPIAYRWLRAHKERLLGRYKGQFDPARWYAFGWQVSNTSGFGDKILASGMNPPPQLSGLPQPGCHFLFRLLHQAQTRR